MEDRRGYFLLPLYFFFEPFNAFAPGNETRALERVREQGSRALMVPIFDACGQAPGCGVSASPALTATAPRRADRRKRPLRPPWSMLVAASLVMPDRGCQRVACRTNTVK